MKVFNNFGLRLTGVLLFLLAIIGLIATTTLSISGGANDYTNLNSLFKSGLNDYLGLFKLSGFIVGTIFIQLMIFAVSAIETFIKIKFSRHYSKVLFLQYGLLVVSIYYNNKFFGSNSLIKLLLCILLDLSVIKLVSLSMDLITLNYTVPTANKKKLETNNILKMWLDNKLFNLKSEIVQTYNQNNGNTCQNTSENIIIESQNNVDTVQHIENTGDNVLYLNDYNCKNESQNTVNNCKDNIELYLSEIMAGQKLNVKNIKNTFNLTAREWEKIRDNNEFLEIRNGFTYKKGDN